MTPAGSEGRRVCGGGDGSCGFFLLFVSANRQPWSSWVGVYPLGSFLGTQEDLQDYLFSPPIKDHIFTVKGQPETPSKKKAGSLVFFPERFFFFFFGFIWLAFKIKGNEMKPY